ncbi:TolC family protein [Ignatzschineria sp. LJL83]
MKKKYMALVAVFFMNQVYAFAQNEVVIRQPFFDAEPPSYLIDISNDSSENNTISEKKYLQEEVFLQNKDGAEDVEIVKPLHSNQLVIENIQDTINQERSFEIKSQSGSHSISLIDATRLIVLTHPRMNQVKANARGEAEMIDVAKSGYYPQVKGGLGLQYNPDNRDRNSRDYVQSINLEVKQTLYDFGKTSSSVKSAEYGYLGAKAYIDATSEELIHTAATMVVMISRYEQLLILAQNQVDQVDYLGNLVESRHIKGASNLSDVLQANSRLDNVMSEALDTEAQYDNYVRTLGLLINQPNIEGASIGQLPKGLTERCSILSDWDDIPEFAMAELEAKRAYADLDRAKADELPTISLDGTSYRPLNPVNKSDSKFESRVSVNVSVPVYQGGGLAAGRRASASRAGAANARKAEVKLEINKAVTEIDVRLQNMVKRKNLLIQRVENLRGTKELYKKQYLELGTRSLLDLLNSEQEFHQAQVEVENNKSDIIQAQLDCAFYQGKLRKLF